MNSQRRFTLLTYWPQGGGARYPYPKHVWSPAGALLCVTSYYQGLMTADRWMVDSSRELGKQHGDRHDGHSCHCIRRVVCQCRARGDEFFFRSQIMALITLRIDPACSSRSSDTFDVGMETRLILFFLKAHRQPIYSGQNSLDSKARERHESSGRLLSSWCTNAFQPN